MSITPALNEPAALERQNGLDLANAGRGLAAAADASIAVAWVQRYAVVYNVVDQIVDTPLFPVGFWPMPVGVKPWDFRTPWLKHSSESLEDYGQRRRIAAAGGTTAALWGEGYGWSPPQSWRLIYVANGKASLYAEGVNALLRAQGFGLERLERSDTIARLRLRRPGGPWVEYEFTMADAERAGYVPGKGPNAGKEKKGGNEKYLTDPKTMLWARCLTTAARIEAPDVIAGMPVAELVDDEPIDPPRSVTVVASARDAEPAVSGSSSAVLASALEQAGSRGAAEVPQPAAVHLDGPGGPSAGPMDEATWRKINARFVQLGRGVNGPGQQNARLYVIGRMVGRTVARGSDLNAAEGDLVLSTLQGTTSERVDELLAERNRVEPGEQRQGEATDESQPATQDDVEAEADELTGEDLEPGPDEGRPAALEGVVDPWARQ